MNVPNHEKKAFRDMTPEERAVIVEAWLVENVDIYAVGRWQRPANDHIAAHQPYRTRPRQLVIPWEHIKPEYKWAAMDEDGRMFVFVTEPVIDKFDPIWRSNDDGCTAIIALNINTAGIDWRESLVRRPDGV